MANKKDSLDSALEAFELPFQGMKGKDKEERKGITMFTSETYHEKYARLQKATSYDFGKRLRKLIETAIDKAEANVFSDRAS